MKEANRFFPFHAIGLQCNPFRTLTEEEWSELVVLPTEVSSLLEKSENHIQIVGDAGWGKSSMLRGIHHWYVQRGIDTVLEYLPIGVNSFHSDLRTASVFLLDEAQRLHQKEFERFLQVGEVGTRLIWSSHEDLLRTAQDSRLKVSHLQLGASSLIDLEIMIDKRIMAFSVDMKPQIRFSHGALEFLERSYGANLRGMFDFLYEFFQTIPNARTISVEELVGFQESSESPNPSG